MDTISGTADNSNADSDPASGVMANRITNGIANLLSIRSNCVRCVCVDVSVFNADSDMVEYDMILYINGGDHAAAAEAVNSFSFANEDHLYFHAGKAPHPTNLKVSFGTLLGSLLKMTLHVDAEAYSSDARIIRTTKEWIEEKVGVVPYEDMFMIIQWTAFFDAQTSLAAIKGFHLYLKKLGIKHIFFNGKDSFLLVPGDDRYDFGESYINPYLPEESFDGWLQLNGYSTVITSNEHYGQDAHAAWAKRLAQHIIDNKML